MTNKNHDAYLGLLQLETSEAKQVNIIKITQNNYCHRSVRNSIINWYLGDKKESFLVIK